MLYTWGVLGSFTFGTCERSPGERGDSMGQSEISTVEERAARSADAPTSTPLSADDADADSDRVVPGLRIGRYTILSNIGAGGMGVVYRGYDELLDRMVALKFIGAHQMQGKSGAAKARYRSRFIQEAHALAKISHPNVVAVYDVGEWKNQLFLAMELVDGVDLKQWMLSEQSDWKRILAVFVDAAKGLRAAHDAGMIHRDFKPENILVGRDGSVKVVDFGLATANDDARPTWDSRSRSRSRSGARKTPALKRGYAERETLPVSTELTQQGTLVGTPAYMAPEQHRGEVLDARADQYAFCVSLYECLYGIRPFVGQTRIEIHESIRAGAIRVGVASTRTPSWLRRIVVRGLAYEPEQRFASMDEMLRKILSHKQTTRRRIAISGLVFISVGVPIVNLQANADRRDTTYQCKRQANVIEKIWNSKQKAVVARAFEESGVWQSERLFDDISRKFAGYQEQWIREFRDACERRERSFSSISFDRQILCLENAKDAFGVFVDTLGRANAEIVRRAQQTVDVLPDLTVCENPTEDWTRELFGPEKSEAQRLTRLLTQTEIRAQAGEYERAFHEYSQLIPQLESATFQPLLAKAQLGFGRLQIQRRRYDESEAAFHASFFAALRVGQDESASIAASELLSANMRMPLAREDRRRSEAALLRAGNLDLLRAGHLRNLAEMGRSRQANWADPQLARKRYSEALEIYKREKGFDSDEVLDISIRLAEIDFWNLGRADDAASMYRHVLEVTESRFGLGHPRRITLLESLGSILAMSGDYRAALEYHRKASGLAENIFGKNAVAAVHTNAQLAETLRAVGQNAEALAQWRVVIESYANAFGREDYRVWFCRGVYELALLRELGRIDEARELLHLWVDQHIERVEELSQASIYALTAREAALLRDPVRAARLLDEDPRGGPVDGSVERATTSWLIAKSELLRFEGQSREALELLQIAKAKEDERIWREDMQYRGTLLALGRALRESGYEKQSMETLLLAYEYYERHAGDTASVTVRIRFELGQTALALGDRKAARVWLESAQALFEPREQSAELGQLIEHTLNQMHEAKLAPLGDGQDSSNDRRD